MAVQPDVVVPVDPFQGRQLDVGDALPRPASSDHFRLVETEEAFGGGVVVGIAAALNTVDSVNDTVGDLQDAAREALDYDAGAAAPSAAATSGPADPDAASGTAAGDQPGRPNT